MGNGKEARPMPLSFELTYRYHTMDYSNAGGDVSLTQPDAGNFELSGLN